MKAVDKIQKPYSFYYEDIYGNRIPYTPNMPDRKWYAQHVKTVVLEHSMCLADKQKDNWVIRVLKWIVCKLPNSWKRHSMSSNSSLTHAYPFIKYFVETKGYSFEEACILYSSICGRCQDILEDEINGTNVFKNLNYKMHTYCDYCNTLDPEYVERRRVWCCYRTLKLGGNINKAYHEISPNSSKVELTHTRTSIFERFAKNVFFHPRDLIVRYIDNFYNIEQK